jgi:hypothetical protein
MKIRVFVTFLMSIFFTISVSAGYYISELPITIKEPNVGEKYSSTAKLSSCTGAEIESVKWYGNFNGGKFVIANDYTVAIKVKVATGSSRVFATSGKMNITINGKKPKSVTYSERSLTIKYTWKQVGGPDVDAPDYKLKTKLAQLAAAYVADNSTDDKKALQYLRSSMPKAEIWCAGGSYKYTIMLPSETKDGKFSMTIGINSDGITIDRYNFVAVIPALNKSPEATMLNADMALMKAALNDLEVTSKTTGKDVLAAVNAAAINGTKAVWDKNYVYTAPRSDLRGSIKGNIILTLGDKSDIIMAYKVLPVAGKASDRAIDADFSAMSKALARMELTNKTTEQDLIDVATAAMTNGSKIVCTSFSKLDATFTTEGKIIANFELTLKDARRIPRLSRVISKRVLDLPKDFPISYDEWEVLRYANIERYKNGMPLFIMPEALMRATDIRAEEIVTDYRKDHRRPNGKAYSTAIDTEFKANRVTGENALKGVTTAQQAVKSWMNSPGHRANILSGVYTFLGIGVTGPENYKYWVQMFASGGGVSRVEISTGSYNFKTVEEMEEAYLICYTCEDIKAYIPLEADYMAKNGNDYTMDLRGQYITVTITGE